MAEHWIKSAIEQPGSFTKSAKRAGEGVQAYAAKEKHAGGVLGKRARLAFTLGKMHHTKTTKA